MRNRMKILIVDDGSRSAEEVLADLRAAGLPSEAEAMLVSLIEPAIPAGLPGLARPISTARESQSEVQRAGFRLRRSCAQLGRIFPDWTMETAVYEGATESGILKIAGEWQPDLLVISPLNRSGFKRLIHGDFARSVVQGAACSVRVARGASLRSKNGLRLLIGFDGSCGTSAAICEVWSRRWPVGAQVHLVAAFKSHLLLHSGLDPDRERYLRSSLKIAAETLNTAGLKVTTAIVEGSPGRVILDEAWKCGADSIFLGTDSGGGVSRLFFGGISAMVASQAHCSVEVVHESMNPAGLPVAADRPFTRRQIRYAAASHY